MDIMEKLSVEVDYDISISSLVKQGKFKFKQSVDRAYLPNLKGKQKLVIYLMSFESDTKVADASQMVTTKGYLNLDIVSMMSLAIQYPDICETYFLIASGIERETLCDSIFVPYLSYTDKISNQVGLITTSKYLYSPFFCLLAR